MALVLLHTLAIKTAAPKRVTVKLFARPRQHIYIEKFGATKRTKYALTQLPTTKSYD